MMNKQTQSYLNHLSEKSKELKIFTLWKKQKIDQLLTSMWNKKQDEEDAKMFDEIEQRLYGQLTKEN